MWIPKSGLSRTLTTVVVFVPTLYAIAFVGVFFWIVFADFSKSDPARVFALFQAASVIHVLVALLVLALVTYNIVLVYKSEPADKRTLWMLIILVAPVITVPVYWVHWMRGEKLPPTPPRSDPQARASEASGAA
jgi:4-hydroxybenzoate polyprenyltransferase